MIVVLTIFSIILTGSLHADEKEDLLVIRNTVINLMQQLVDQGVMSPEQAKQLIETAKESAVQEAQEIRAAETPVSPGVYSL